MAHPFAAEESLRRTRFLRASDLTWSLRASAFGFPDFLGVEREPVSEFHDEPACKRWPNKVTVAFNLLGVQYENITNGENGWFSVTVLMSVQLGKQASSHWSLNSAGRPLDRRDVMAFPSGSRGQRFQSPDRGRVQVVACGLTVQYTVFAHRIA